MSIYVIYVGKQWKTWRKTTSLQQTIQRLFSLNSTKVRRPESAWHRKIWCKSKQCCTILPPNMRDPKSKRPQSKIQNPNGQNRKSKRLLWDFGWLCKGSPGRASYLHGLARDKMRKQIWDRLLTKTLWVPFPLQPIGDPESLLLFHILFLEIRPASKRDIGGTARRNHPKKDKKKWKQSSFLWSLCPPTGLSTIWRAGFKGHQLIRDMHMVEKAY